MNDFTKEELQHIYESLDLLCALGCSKDGPIFKIKIQSMIDDLPKCDHRSGLHNYNENGEIVSYDTDIYRCRHCDALFRFIFDRGIGIGHEELE